MNCDFANCWLQLFVHLELTNYLVQPICFGCAFRTCVLPEELTNKLPEMIEIQKMFGFDWLYNGFAHYHIKFDTRNTQMHVNTSPTCFEGTRVRKMGFRDPGCAKQGVI